MFSIKPLHELDPRVSQGLMTLHCLEHLDKMENAGVAYLSLLLKRQLPPLPTVTADRMSPPTLTAAHPSGESPTKSLEAGTVAGRRLL